MKIIMSVLLTLVSHSAFAMSDITGDWVKGNWKNGGGSILHIEVLDASSASLKVYYCNHKIYLENNGKCVYDIGTTTTYNPFLDAQYTKVFSDVNGPLYGFSYVSRSWTSQDSKTLTEVMNPFNSPEGVHTGETSIYTRP